MRSRLEHLLRDFVACSLAGRVTPAARIAADYAAAQHPGDAATSAFDGRPLSATGAAWANGVLANALDFDDGHRLCKGHPGANVIPAALAVAESVRASPDELRRAILLGYEVAIRAGVALHARSAEYHASGAWGALGAAAAAGTLLGLDDERMRYALGLADALRREPRLGKRRGPGRARRPGVERDRGREARALRRRAAPLAATRTG